jgi:PAS domain S-box-containing protein
MVEFPLLRSVRRVPALGRWGALALAVVALVGVFLLRENDRNAANADEILFVLPIAIVALRFGMRGGLTCSLGALALIVTWDILDNDAALSVWAYCIRGLAFVILGGLLGGFVDSRRRLQAEVSRSFDHSLDLLGTADLNGRLTRVNPAWERLLGHSPETICSRPFVDFVHPEDREATVAEAAAVASGERDTFRFRNRYRAADGRYVLLEWSAHGSPSEGLIHVVGRDIRAQHEAEQQLADNAQWLESKVAERTRELDEARAETLQRLAVAAEYRDDETSQHTQRVGSAAAELARRLELPEDEIEVLRESAALHDVGKLGIPDALLLKPGKLTAAEYEVMKTHTVLGARLLSGSASPVLQMAAVIAETHHERWDGTGYPAGLAGEDTPLAGRIVAVADVYDALTHDRPYKTAWTAPRATEEIARGAGSQFDPEVVGAFLAIREQAASVNARSAPTREPAVGRPRVFRDPRRRSARSAGAARQ